MPEHRQPHTHATCGFCLRPVIVRSKPREERAGQPICPECLVDWGGGRCFPQPTPVQYVLTLDK